MSFPPSGSRSARTRHAARHPSCVPVPGVSPAGFLSPRRCRRVPLVAHPERLLAGPRLLAPALEIVLLVPLAAANLGSLVRYLFEGGTAGGSQLIRAAAPIWSTMVPLLFVPVVAVDVGDVNRRLVLVIFGSVSANRRHYQQAVRPRRAALASPAPW